MKKSGYPNGRRGLLMFLLLLTGLTVFEAIGLVSGEAALAAGKASEKAKGIEAITRPNYDAELSFPLQGRISEVLVKAGAVVKKGQLLVKLEDDVEQARVKYLKAEAEDDTRVEAAVLQCEQKKLDLERVEVAFKQGVATKMELEHARLDVKIQELSVKLAKFQKKQAGLEYQQALEQLDRMRIAAPCDGIVENCVAEVGQSVEQAMQVVRLVNINPLWVDVPVPIATAANLKKGRAATVSFDLPGKDNTATGKIIHIAMVADSASETRTVRLSVPNAANRPAGTRVWVCFVE